MTTQDTAADLLPAMRLGRTAREPLTREEEWKYAKLALTWYGWGSPIGLSVFLLSLAAAAAVVRWIVAGL